MAGSVACRRGVDRRSSIHKETATIARKRVMIGAVMARDPDDAYGSPGPAGANRQIEVDALMRGSRPLLEID
jgi:hypothetical protein